MRSKSVILFALILVTFLASSKAMGHGVFLSGKPLIEIEAQLRADPRLYRMEKLELNGRTVLAAIFSVGSGAYVWVLEIFVEHGSLAGSKIMQKINTSYIEFQIDTGELEFQADQVRNELIVKSADGRELFRIPSESFD